MQSHRGLFKCYWVYKPGSVLTAIYLVVQLLTRSSRLLEAVGPTCMLLHGVASDRVYSTPVFPRSGWSLTPPFHPYSAAAERYLSVALVLRSPSAGVTRYPCPVKPGLSSPAAFPPAAAAVQPGRTLLYSMESKKSNVLQNCSEEDILYL